MPLQIMNRTLILDASCLITLYASQRMAEILQAIPKMITVAAYVVDQEALFVRTAPDGNGVRHKEKIDLQQFVDVGLLHIVDLQSDDEAEEYLTLSSQRIDRGEAVTGALALCRGYAIVIDDKKARRVLQQRNHQLQLLHTLDLVKHWIDLHTVTEEGITTTLQLIRSRAIYTPPKEHHLYDWWHRYRGG